MDRISEAAPLYFIKNDESQPPWYHGLEAPKAIGLVMYFMIRAVAIKLFKVMLKFQSTYLKTTLLICCFWVFSRDLAASGYPHAGWPHKVSTSCLSLPRAAEPRADRMIISRVKPECHLTSWQERQEHKIASRYTVWYLSKIKSWAWA